MSVPGLLALRATALVLVAGGLAVAQDLDLKTGPALLNPLAKLDPMSFKAFLERPLFSPTRRTAEKPAVENVAKVVSTTNDINIRLLGIVITPEGAIARIADADDKKNHSLRQGEIYQGWHVDRIDGSTVKLSRADVEQTFSVFVKPLTDPDMKIAAEAKRKNTSDSVSPPGTPDMHAIGIVKRLSAASDDTLVENRAKSHQQDLVDFFGKTGKPAE